MHRWDEATDLLAHSVIGYAIERLKTSKDPTWGARPAEQLASALEGVIRPEGIGGHQALTLFRDVLMHACRPMDSPLHLAYVATAPTPAANMFDLVVSASSIFGGLWEGGAGAIAAENQTLAWLAGLAGFPDGAGGCFVTGGSAANLSALVTARHHARLRHGEPPGGRWRFATTGETHASVHAAARVMDVDVVLVPPDERGRMTGAALRATLDDAGLDGLFAVVGNFGTTNAGAIDELDAIADVCADARPVAAHRRRLRRRRAVRAVDRRASGSGSSGPTASASTPTSGCSRRTTAPHSSTATRRWRRPPTPSTARTSTWSAATSGTPATSPSTCRARARGLPLWFSLATYGTDAYAEAVETTLDVARRFAADVDAATGSGCCSSRSSRSCCSPSTGGTRPATRRGAGHGPGPAWP